MTHVCDRPIFVCADEEPKRTHFPIEAHTQKSHQHFDCPDGNFQLAITSYSEEEEEKKINYEVFPWFSSFFLSFFFLLYFLPRKLKSRKSDSIDESRFNVQEYVKEQTNRSLCSACNLWRNSIQHPIYACRCHFNRMMSDVVRFLGVAHSSGDRKPALYVLTNIFVDH